MESLGRNAFQLGFVTQISFRISLLMDGMERKTIKYCSTTNEVFAATVVSFLWVKVAHSSSSHRVLVCDVYWL